MTYKAQDAAKDLILGQAQFSTKEVADARMAVCTTCPNFQKIMRVCSSCGCFLPAKVKFQNSSCPINNW